jgi:hypothetical protein
MVRVMTKKQILPKTEAEEQWRNFYSYDKSDMRLVLLTIILSPGPLQLIIDHQIISSPFIPNIPIKLYPPPSYLIFLEDK